MTDFYSQAFNFAGAVKGQVDPRTGLFAMNMPLVNLVGNNNLGPSLNVQLCYSPLSSAQQGLGLGCSLGLSQYDRSTRTLSLSSGESYKIVETSDQVFIQQNKARGVRFEKLPEQDAYRLTHKSGEVEWFTGPMTGGDIKVPVQLFTPIGHCLTLEWDWTHGTPRLLTISDESDQVLLSLVYEEGLTSLQVWPDSNEAYELALVLRNGYLSSLRHNGIEPALQWDFDYQQVGQRNLLCQVQAPTGLLEQVQYQDQVQRFPNSALVKGALPAVVRHRVLPGADQVPIETSYRYTSSNYLGFEGEGGSWSPDTDYLYGVPTSYRYGSTAESAGEVTERRYNSFHLQILEQVTDQECIHTTELHYDIQEGAAFDEQAVWFQLPVRTTLRYEDQRQDADSQGKFPTREEETRSEYDEWANLIRQTTPDGTVTEWQYFPPEGGDGAPAEQNGFQRLLAQQIVRPSSRYAAAPEQRTEYRYGSLPTVEGSESVLPGYAAVQVQSRQYSGQILLSSTSTFYEDDAQSTELGRIVRLQEDRYAGLEAGGQETAYRYTQDFSFALRAGLLVQDSTVRTFDDLVTSTSRSQSPWSAHLISETDPAGNITQYEYDGVGRLLRKCVNQGSAYEQASLFEYGFDSDGLPITTISDPKHNQTRSWYDGLGRMVRQSRREQGAEDWEPVSLTRYDAQNRIVESRSFDRTSVLGGASGLSPVSVVQTFQYDGWGRVCRQQSNRGLVQSTLNDPVNLCVVQQTENVGLGSEQTRYNLQGQPASSRRLGTDGSLGGEVQREYDGLKRLLSSTDAMGQTTRYEYDAWGRVCMTVLSDGSRIAKRYAPFAGTSTWMTEVSLNDVVQGTQSFDGQGRVQVQTSGQRSYSYLYENSARVQPCSITGPDAVPVHYRCIPELGEAVDQIRAAEIEQKFEYDPLSALLRQVWQDESRSQVMSYSSQGYLLQEQFEQSAHPLQTTEYRRSPNGLPLSFLDVTGVRETYMYNEVAQLKVIEDQQVQVGVDYDQAGRVVAWTVKAAQGDLSLRTRLTYDSFDRESERDIDNGHQRWTISQEYTLNDQLSKRVTRCGEQTVRSEWYEYDARHRLQSYRCEADETMRPLDAYGTPIHAQQFVYDANSNLLSCITQFEQGQDEAVFEYSAPDPNQLSAITHSHPAYPSRVELQYDARGRLTQDEAGRTLHYDALGRLKGVETGQGQSSTYRYDGYDRLISQVLPDSQTLDLYYSGDQLSTVASRGGKQQRLVSLAGTTVAQCQAGDPSQIRLLGVDAQNSVLLQADEQELRSQSYGPYGQRGSSEGFDSVLAYTGERVDPVTGGYHLGNGYRTYSPALMRFHSPDNLSPFGQGGLNPYVYCDGDPINHRDPGGHLSWSAWLGIGLGIAGILATVVTFGVAAAPVMMAEGVAAGLVAGVQAVGIVGAFSLVSDATMIASGAVEESSPEASSILGWVSFGTGMLSLGAGVAESLVKGLGKQGGRATERLLEAGESERGLGMSSLGRSDQDTWGGPKVREKGKNWLDYEDKASKSFKSYKKPGGGKIWLNKYEVFGEYGMSIVDEAVRNDREVVVLTGTHGDPHGVRLASMHPEQKFFNEDARNFAGHIERGKVKLIDMSRTSEEVLKAELQRDVDVVGLFCHSRNDRVLLDFLDKRTATSFIPPPCPR